MIDHIGMPVGDIARATEFYLKALSPLGYGIVMQVSAEETGHGAAVGFGAGQKPSFWIAEGEPRAGRCMWPSSCHPVPRSMSSMPRR
jgi:catechol 2,3-dioxygenase-like lactoylglutathione lyase family enzyme